MKTILLLLAIVAVFAGHHNDHKCVHDRMQERFGEREITYLNLDETTTRRLQTATPRKMKITYDMSFFDKLDTKVQTNLDFKVNCEKAIKIAIDYFNQLIEIVPKAAGTMKWDKKTDTCGKVTVPEADKKNDKDSDLHLYVSYTYESSESFLAYAGWCRFLDTYGASHGQVNFNQAKIGTQNLNDPIIFQDLVQTTIHEIIHVLGFSSEVYKNWVDKDKKVHTNPTGTAKIRGKDVTIIKTPNVLKAAQDYYGCKSITGMPLENQGSSGSAGSHWETTVILDEMMNPQASATNSIMTVFTLALLKDTGFYSKINDSMVEPSFYGKDEGCGFVSETCDTNKREFCKSGASSGCDYHYIGSAACKSGTFTDSGCSNWTAYGNGKCFDAKSSLNTPQNQSALGATFGITSKCFMSSLIDKKYVPKKEQEGNCFSFECTADNRVVVTVGSKKVTCSKNGEKVTVEGFSGDLTCPEKLDEFCKYKKFCPNHCSSNGYCVNGKCQCANGIKTADCK